MNDQLTEDERKQVAAARDLRSRGRPLLGFSDDLLRIIDRLTSAAPVPEGVPEDHRVCSHGIYHHGCPSCDRQDPEEL